MNLKYPHNPSNPITSSAEYQTQRHLAEQKQTWKTFKKNLPHMLISRCPHCEQETWMEAEMIFTLSSGRWYQKWNDGRLGVKSACEHLFCVDGALNLNGNAPMGYKSTQNSYIHMASEAPYVKPRVLKLPTMCAVMHQLPIVEGKYTAYPVVYFATQKPKDTDYCIAWAAEIHIANCSSGFIIHGRRADKQDYELNKWVKRGSLFWLDMEDDEFPLTNDRAKFPYNNIAGRQHPYFILNNGEIVNRPLRNQQRKSKHFFEHDSMI